MLTVIGCGNLMRRDDGVGVVVAQRLAARLLAHPVPGVQAFDCGTAGFEVMYRARGSHALCVIDASQSGAAPGTIHELPGDTVTSTELPSVNLHEFRWDHALAVGRAIYKQDFPEDVKVFLIEAGDLGHGDGLSEAVEQAAERVYKRLLEHCAQYAAARAPQLSAAEQILVARRGSLQLPRELFDALFGERCAAAVLSRADDILVVPVLPEDGGVLVKQKNAQGDRAVDVREALRSQGWDDMGTLTLQARVDRSLGGLVLAPLPLSQPSATPTTPESP
jgi:hydrogenase maturation protease